jgi:Cu/Ag efflux protein CusF
MSGFRASKLAWIIHQPFTRAGTKVVPALLSRKEEMIMKLLKAILLTAIASLVGTAAPAQEMLTGTIAGVDEQKGTITIKQTQSGTVGESGTAQELKAQDGLLFSAVQPGDKITFTVSDINGTKTITKLNKQ